MDPYSELAMEEEVMPLHNPAEPRYEIKREKLEHRLMAHLKVQGFSNKEIADKLGYTAIHVNQIVRQSWFREMVLSELKAQGDFSAASMFAIEAENSILKLIELRDKAKKEEVQLASAVQILDRFLGKPTQKVEVKKEFKEKVSEIEQIDTEIQQLEGELARRN